ncbi:Restriction endonuclease [Perilla frutescens var. hirtella]|uniref:Restriction endonuclease n=1 Tax=Perilla frutescens var. hirtella TaxID=608512 RepID=A0AAD4JHL0_PERFH|nr:Restriction endonuclease [Perilla frutescens var. hirtella]
MTPYFFKPSSRPTAPNSLPPPFSLSLSVQHFSCLFLFSFSFFFRPFYSLCLTLAGTTRHHRSSTPSPRRILLHQPYDCRFHWKLEGIAARTETAAATADTDSQFPAEEATLEYPCSDAVYIYTHEATHELVVSDCRDHSATCSDGGARLMKNLRRSISSVRYSEFNKHINNFEKVIISSCYGNWRSYSDSRSPASFSNEAHPILQSSELQHWFKNWQHLRKDKLTASTFALAVGFWPRGRARLWLEKLGTIEPFSGNLATCWSNIKEEEALERYKLITGNTVLYPEFQVYGKNNPEDSWLGASPDGAIDSYIYGLPSHGVLEIKCPFFGGDMSRATPWKRVPLHYIPQAQGLMEIFDRDWMDMYVWTVNGSSLFRIYRNVEYWDTLKIALSDFWWNHVQPAKEICNRTVITNPLIELSSLRPSPKHELHRRIVYESKLIVDNSKLLLREIHGRLQD